MTIDWTRTKPTKPGYYLIAAIDHLIGLIEVKNVAEVNNITAEYWSKEPLKIPKVEILESVE